MNIEDMTKEAEALAIVIGSRCVEQHSGVVLLALGEVAAGAIFESAPEHRRALFDTFCNVVEDFLVNLVETEQ